MFQDFFGDRACDGWDGFASEAEFGAVVFGEKGWWEGRGEVPFDTVAQKVRVNLDVELMAQCVLAFH